MTCWRWRYRIWLCHAFCDLCDDSSDNWRDGVLHLLGQERRKEMSSGTLKKIKLVVIGGVKKGFELTVCNLSQAINHLFISRY